MKKFSLITIAAVILTAPLSAMTVKVEFKDSTGSAAIWTFDDATKMATPAGGAPVPYTYDEDTRKLCSSLEGSEICATYDEEMNAPGSSSPFTRSDGDRGVATLLEVKE